MANKVYNMDGGLHSSAALGAFEDSMYGSCVGDASSFVVTAGTGMNVTVSTGNGLISTGTGFARRIGTDATNTVSITAASTASPRIDSVVAYIDNSVTPTESVLNNTNGILNFKSVPGTAAANPVAPGSSAIQSVVGAGNPYMVLYNITVPANATSLTTATFTDMRNIANVTSSSDIANGAISTAKIANSAVTAAKIGWSDIGNKYTNSATQITISTSATTLLTLALTAGTWLLIGTSDFNHSNTDTGDCFVGFDNASTSAAIGQRFYFNEKADGTYWSTCTATETVTLTGAANISFVAKKGQGTLLAQRRSFVAVRIA